MPEEKPFRSPEDQPDEGSEAADGSDLAAGKSPSDDANATQTEADFDTLTPMNAIDDADYAESSTRRRGRASRARRSRPADARNRRRRRNRRPVHGARSQVAAQQYARKTLPGSGGFDPNPDFADEGFDDLESGDTVPHIVPFEHTLVHVPGEEHPPRKAAPSARPLPTPQTTIPSPPVAQRTQQAAQASQPAYPLPQRSASHPLRAGCRRVRSRVRAGFWAARRAAPRLRWAWWRLSAAA